jgi:hypothetical protein
MKYKLINSVSKIETICDKVTIDGFDHYLIMMIGILGIQIMTLCLSGK